MVDATRTASVAPFRDPKKAFRGLKPEAAALVVAAAADIALVLEGDGKIVDASAHSGVLPDGHAEHLLGQYWRDVVTAESRVKVEDALRTVKGKGLSNWREINHVLPGGEELPLRVLLVSLQSDDRFLVMARDLRDTAQLQRRLVQAQQQMEREYSRVRQAELRYRLLFQSSAEAVVVVDTDTQKVREINPAAELLLRVEAQKVQGRALASVFTPQHGPAVAQLFSQARAAGAAEAGSIELVNGGELVKLQATHFAFGRGGQVLVRVLPSGHEAGFGNQPRGRLLALVESAPEGFVVTDFNGTILSANAAFLEMTQAPTMSVLEGQQLERWLGRPGAEFGSLEMQVKQDGAVRFFQTSVRGILGDMTDVEVSGVAVPDGAVPCLGFIVRDTGGRLSTQASPRGALPSAVEQMRELVGRVPLKDLVRETTDIIERMCIETALQITKDNRASAAEILGLSRQSLYVKLRRYGLDDGRHETTGED
ncbi:MAG: transcriptional regulator PpsR [Hyphomicrobiaceae bacterium]